ncbi:hypothetical protein [Anoxybacillus kestanbolensis]|uniref:hypothetical protein n=1 Tax=Anoxybacillus kestanbolensis TaxID=227476 RepID=UPI003D224FD7
MRTYEETLRKLFVNYTIGSILAVIGVGSTLMVMALNIRQVDLLMLLLIQFFSFCVMLFIEQENGQWKLVGIIHDEWTT